MSSTAPFRPSGRARPLSLVLLLVAGAVGMGMLRDDGDDGPGPEGVPRAVAERAGGCAAGGPECDAPPGPPPGQPPPPVLSAAEVCYGAGYLCSGLEQRGEIRIVRWNDDTGRLRVRVPLPAVADEDLARSLQAAAARGIRAWHNRPFPLRVDLSDRPGSHHFVVGWSRRLEGLELGRTRTHWVRRNGRADLEVREFSLATHNPWDVTRRLLPEQIELTAAHEMGHALGLPHSDEPRDVMYPENTATRLTARDFTTMSALYELENGAVVR